MSINALGAGRCSAILHMGIQFPKICGAIAVAGAVWYTAPSLTGTSSDIARYCNQPTEANRMSLTPALRARIDEACGCLKEACSAPHQ